jgi:hypothetical protein
MICFRNYYFLLSEWTRERSRRECLLSGCTGLSGLARCQWALVLRNCASMHLQPLCSRSSALCALYTTAKTGK